MREGHGLVSIWFFIGLLLVIYGVLILGASLYALFVPPSRATVLGELHPGIWWGALLIGLGSIYTHRYHPRRYRS